MASIREDNFVEIQICNWKESTSISMRQRVSKSLDYSYVIHVQVCRNVFMIFTRPDMTYNVFGGMLNLAQSINLDLHSLHSLPFPCSNSNSHSRSRYENYIHSYSHQLSTGKWETSIAVFYSTPVHQRSQVVVCVSTIQLHDSYPKPMMLTRTRTRTRPAPKISTRPASIPVPVAYPYTITITR